MRAVLHSLGEVDYAAGLALQAQFAREATADTIHVLALTHPPTVTLGRRASRDNLLVSGEWLAQRGVQLVQTDRGGDITYHGPEQVVVYPIFALGDLPIRRYVSLLEMVLIRYLARFDLVARGDPARPGVYVGEDKLGFIGLRISEGVAQHGFALNLSSNLEAFTWLNSCGQPGTRITSLGRLRPPPPTSATAAVGLFEELSRVFSEESSLLRSPFAQ